MYRPYKKNALNFPSALASRASARSARRRLEAKARAQPVFRRAWLKGFRLHE